MQPALSTANNEELEDGEIFDDDDDVPPPPVKEEKVVPPLFTIIQPLKPRRLASPLNDHRNKGRGGNQRGGKRKRNREDDRNFNQRKRQRSEERVKENEAEIESLIRLDSPQQDDWERIGSDEEDEEMCGPGKRPRDFNTRRRRGLNRAPNHNNNNRRAVNRRDQHQNNQGAQQNQQHGNHNNQSSNNLCKYHVQGKCPRGPDCPYFHYPQNQKYEVCKFYLNDRCIKKEKCHFMHNDYPCKYFNLGLKCYAGKRCKFTHLPVDPYVKEMLIKHNETDTDKNFLLHLETIRNGPNQRPDPWNFEEENKNIDKPYFEHDYREDSDNGEFNDDRRNRQDHNRGASRRRGRRRMLRNSNSNSKQQPRRNNFRKPFENKFNNEEQDRVPTNQDRFQKNDPNDSDEGSRTPMPSPTRENSNDREEDRDCDRHNRVDESKKSSDHTHHRDRSPKPDSRSHSNKRRSPVWENSPSSERELEINESECYKTDYQPDTKDNEAEENTQMPTLPHKQRELFMRIQHQHRKKEKSKGHSSRRRSKADSFKEDDWYSSDDDGGPVSTILKTLKASNSRKAQAAAEAEALAAATEIKDAKTILPDIDVSAVSKLLSSVRETIGKQQTNTEPEIEDKVEEKKEEKLKRRDPRLVRTTSKEEKKVLNVPVLIPPLILDQDLRPGKGDSMQLNPMSDVDLRQLPFKPVPDHQVAKEIDASINAHAPMNWILQPLLPLPKPDFSSIQIKNPNDPRIRNYSPASPTSPASPPPQQFQQPPPQVPQVPEIRDPRQRAILNDPRRKAQMLQQPPPLIPQLQIPIMQMNRPPFLPPHQMFTRPRMDSDLRNPMYNTGDMDFRVHQGPPNFFK